MDLQNGVTKEIQDFFLRTDLEKLNKLKFPHLDGEFGFKEKEFKVLQIISVGFNVIKSLEHRPTDTKLAGKYIKIPNKSDERRIKHIINEITIHCMLPINPNVIDCYGVGLCKEKIMFCLEIMDIPLSIIKDAFHSKKEYFPENLLHYVIISVLNGLNFCHQNKVFHRDLKPSNILVNWTGEIKINDFGHSCFVDATSLATSNDVGTLVYWAPERCSLNNYEYSAFDSRSDIWSLGITLLELICGEIPVQHYLSKLEQPIDFSSLTQTIKNIDSQLLINVCFDKVKQEHHPNKLTKKFITKCLNKLEDRPRNEQLKDEVLKMDQNYGIYFEESNKLCPLVTMVLNDIKEMAIDNSNEQILRNEESLRLHLTNQQSPNDSDYATNGPQLHTSHVPTASMLTPETPNVEQQDFNVEQQNNVENDESAEDSNYGENSPLLSSQDESNIENAHNVEKAPALISKHRIYIVMIFILISLIIAVAVAVVEIIKFSNNTHKSTTTFPFTTSSLSTTSPSLKCLDQGWTYFEQTNSCYTVKRRSTTWSEANRTCEAWKAHLVSIHNQEEENFVKNLSGNFSSISIGLHTYASSYPFIDSYKWTDGSTVNYINWADGQPPDDKSTHCVFIDKGKWNTNIQCTLSDDIVYVCKKPPVS